MGSASLRKFDDMLRFKPPRRTEVVEVLVLAVGRMDSAGMLLFKPPHRSVAAEPQAH
jgi:hypothetical protein